MLDNVPPSSAREQDARHSRSAAAAAAHRPSLARRLLRTLRKVRRIRHPINAFIGRYSLIGDPAVFAPDVIPALAGIAAHWREIRAEAEAVFADPVLRPPPLSEISPDHRRLDHGRSWHAFFLWGYGYRVDSHCARAPLTARLVEQVPGLLSAFFSLHRPGTHLPAHRGVTKAFITCHLALKVPPQDEGLCAIRVEDRLFRWQEGCWFVFDDTREHEVWNETRTDRLILLLHVRRPLAGLGRILGNLFLGVMRASPFVQHTRRLLAGPPRRPLPQGESR